MSQTPITELKFPIALLRGSLRDINSCLDDIIFYNVYLLARPRQGQATDAQNFTEAARLLGISSNDPQAAYLKAQDMFVQYRTSPFAGISMELLKKYYNKPVAEFDVACLLGYIALRSILLDRPWHKTTKAEIYARMTGRTSLPSKERSGERYLKRYHMDRLLRALEAGWGLHTFSHQTMGLYFGFEQTSLQELALINEAHKHRPKDHTRRDANAAALTSANAALGRSTTAKPQQQHNDSTTTPQQQHNGSAAAAPQQHNDSFTAPSQHREPIPCLPCTTTKHILHAENPPNAIANIRPCPI
ncbi:MAG: hypothetical protein EOO06_00050 [Chitinophagaceae bacterium]|nr:MAG: hypothetical protein EOO06_00050 [Chitinophagaceae bacterium]